MPFPLASPRSHAFGCDDSDDLEPDDTLHSLQVTKVSSQSMLLQELGEEPDDNARGGGDANMRPPRRPPGGGHKKQRKQQQLAHPPDAMEPSESPTSDRMMMNDNDAQWNEEDMEWADALETNGDVFDQGGFSEDEELTLAQMADKLRTMINNLGKRDPTSTSSVRRAASAKNLRELQGNAVRYLASMRRRLNGELRTTMQTVKQQPRQMMENTAKHVQRHVVQRTNRLRRRIITGDADMRVRDYIKVPKTVRAIDKFSFTMGVVGLLVTEAVLLQAPQYFWAFFALVMPTLLFLRIYLYTKQKLQYFMYDFCYYVQITCFINLFLLPDERLFLVNFAFSHGPLLWAIIAWRNSLVFHSLDKVTSVYIHTFPPLMTWAWRWYGLCRLPGEALKRATLRGLEAFTRQIDSALAQHTGGSLTRKLQATFEAAPNAVQDAARASLQIGTERSPSFASRAARIVCTNAPFVPYCRDGGATSPTTRQVAPMTHASAGWNDMWRGDHDEMCLYSASKIPASYLLYPLAGYFLWQVLYLIKTEVIDSSKLAADPSLSTSLRWVASDSRMTMHRVGLRLSRKMRIMRHDENFDPTSIKTKLIFCWWQLVYTFFTLLPVIIFYQSFWIHTAFMLWVFGVCIQNGASYYVEVYSHSYEKLYGEAPQGGMDPDQRPEDALAEMTTVSNGAPETTEMTDATQVHED
ncbi:glycerophosphocholine acyltransferase [Pycnococcus provasolii]